jgi:hypothetical protein
MGLVDQSTLAALHGKAALETIRRYHAGEITERQACDWFDVDRLTLRTSLAAANVRVGDAGLRDALLNWYDTTHGNGFGHDHHCPAPWNDQPHTQPIFDGCTCGWSDVQRADEARSRTNDDRRATD